MTDRSSEPRSFARDEGPLHRFWTDPLRSWRAAGMAVLAVCVCLALRLLILPIDGRVVFSTFYPAVALVAITAGLGWGIFATALSTGLVYAFLMPPLLEWKPVTYVDVLSIGTFLAVATIILWAIESQRKLTMRLRGMGEERTAVLQTASSGIARIRNGKFEYANAAMETLVMADAGGLVGCDTTFLFRTPEDRDAFRTFSRSILATHGHFETEIEFLRLNGEPFWCRLRGRGIRRSEPALAVWVFDDMTAEHNARQAMAEARDMAEDATRTKAEFLANMSHEIRTPMNAILGFVHLLLRTNLDPRQRGYLTKIQTAGQNLLTIINDILDFSKAEAGGMSLEETEFHLPEVLRNVADLVSQSAQDKGLELILDLDPTLPEYFIGDPLRLGQAVLNYASNAVKFTERGQIVLRVRAVSEDGETALLRIDVQDTGIGLSPDQQARLFRSFSQADGSTTRLHGGTGLGLVITKHIAELMAGEVGVSSRVGEGSDFWFTARLRRAARKGQRFAPSPDLHGIRVLLVDDNATARMVLRDVLRSMSFEVVEHATGEAAILALEKAVQEGKDFNVMLIDASLPGIDAVTAVHRARQQLGAKMPHALMVTSLPRPELEAAAHDAGIAAVLIKPIDASLLFDTLMQLWGRPGRAERQAEGAADEALRLALQGRRVLLAEDNPLNQDVAKELLATVGVTVSVAENGRKALEMLAADPGFDLVLMDMQMPEMDGLEATRRIRAMAPPLGTMPIVAMSANILPADRAAGLEAGVNDYLGKPVEPVRMWRTIARCLGLTVEPTPAPAAPEAPLPPELAPYTTVPGLDLKAGLSRSAGRVELYTRVLGRFAADQAKSLAEIDTALQQGRIEDATRAAHSLKGTAGQIGADGLAAEAAMAEAALREGKPPALDALGAALATVIAPLSAIALPQPQPLAAPPAAAPATAEDFAQLGELAELLAAGDYAAVQHFARHHDRLLAVLGPDRLAEVSRKVETFDLEGAATELRQALAQTGPAA